MIFRLCSAAPIHCLNKWWPRITWPIRNELQSKLNTDAKCVIKNAFANVVGKRAASCLGLNVIDLLKTIFTCPVKCGSFLYSVFVLSYSIDVVSTLSYKGYCLWKISHNHIKFKKKYTKLPQWGGNPIRKVVILVLPSFFYRFHRDLFGKHELAFHVILSLLHTEITFLTQ